MGQIDKNKVRNKQNSMRYIDRQIANQSTSHPMPYLWYACPSTYKCRQILFTEMSYFFLNILQVLISFSLFSPWQLHFMSFNVGTGVFFLLFYIKRNKLNYFREKKKNVLKEIKKKVRIIYSKTSKKKKKKEASKKYFSCLWFLV